jgi:predicted acyl esterase
MSDEVLRIEAAPVPDTATEHMVAMRDGTRLATDVYLPSGGEPTEAVLVRLPYDKDSRYVFFDKVAARFTSAGYAVVVQDVRGKFRSEGETVGFLGEPADGFDTIDWVIRQPWSNGVVGMFGDSYYGFTQWAAVSAGHPALKAIVPRVTSADLGAEIPTSGCTDVPWMVHADYVSHYWVDHDVYEYEQDYSLRPLTEIFEHAFRRVGGRSAFYDLTVPEYRVGELHPFGHPFDAPAVPVLHVVGWFDNLLIPSMRDYEALSQRPEWAANQYLSADSVDHENYHLSLAPIADADDHLLDDRALARMLELYVTPALEFFDVFLKDRASRDSLPQVAWHLGHVGYRTSPSWPPPEAEQDSLTLSGLSGAAAGSGVLGPPADEDDDATWTHDPTDLVPSSVPNSFAFLHEYPDERDLLRRGDVISFWADAQARPLDLAGPVDLRVTVTSTAPSTDVFAKLFDVHPDGTARMILRGQATLHQAQTAAPATISLGHTGYRVREGHRLVLAVFSSDYPEFVPHPGTGDNRWTATEPASSTQTLHPGGVFSFWRLPAG